MLAAVLFPASGQGATLRGQILSGATPLPSLLVVLYATDPSHPLRCAGALGAAPTGSDGSFELSYAPPAAADAVLYLIADGRSVTPGNLQRLGKCREFAGPVVLASVLGTAGSAPVPTDVVVNERTTVASAYALAQFVDGPRIDGKAAACRMRRRWRRTWPTLRPARWTRCWDVSERRPDRDAGLVQLPRQHGRGLRCVDGACTTLFDLATPPRGPAPTDTFQAVVDIARHPAKSRRPCELFALSLLPPAPYQPARPSDSPRPPGRWLCGSPGTARRWTVPGTSPSTTRAASG